MLHVAIARHEPRFVAHRGKAALDELDRLDDDRRGTVAARARHGVEDPGPDRGMDDRLEIPKGGGIGEDQATEGGAIQSPVGTPVRLAESSDHRFERGFSGFDDIAGDLVGIDGDDARTLTQPARDGRLAAADRAGQAEDQGRSAGRLRFRAGIGHPPSLGAAQDQLLPDHEDPLQELPDQLLPDHELPDQDDPLQLLPDHDEPLQLLPLQELPDQDEPLHELPDQLLPDHDEPFQVPPDQLWPAASRSAMAAASNGWPKMSCSPVRTTPSIVR
jgi:hypothetical protein